MNYDLKMIKKRYGEKMSHLCRQLFPTILETEGLLFQLLSEHLSYSNSIYEDIMAADKVKEFKGYIYKFLEEEEKIETKQVRSAQDLLDEAGYKLYECKTEEEIQSFKKYYREKEALCTFDGDRLNRCHVFFAVKKDVEQITRFQYPSRQDEYGTSVISIQFEKDEWSTLSIKNRYNHTVINPDATFSNDLDKIIPGLTEGFKHSYGLIQTRRSDNFELPNYVCASDGKFYKFNHEINGIYYCENNVIVENYEALQLKKEEYLLTDYFILDFKKKECRLYDQNINDSFTDAIGEIKDISVVKEKDGKIVTIINKDNQILKLTLDKYNNIMKLVSNGFESIKDGFLQYNRVITDIKLEKCKVIGNDFMINNQKLTTFSAPTLESVGEEFLKYNQVVTSVITPHLKSIGNYFMRHNKTLQEYDFSSLESIGDGFLFNHDKLQQFSAPRLKYIGNKFMYNNKLMTKFDALKILSIGNGFMISNKGLTTFKAPNLLHIGNGFIHANRDLKELYVPNLQYIGSNFMGLNNKLEQLILPNVEYIGEQFMYCNQSVNNMVAPKLKQTGDLFMMRNKYKDNFYIPGANNQDSYFMDFDHEEVQGNEKVYTLATV